MPEAKWATDIIEKVERHHEDTFALRERFDDDYSRWRLDEYDANEGKGDAFRSYTSSEPRNVGEKIVSWLVASKMIPRIPHDDSPRDEREADDAKERFIIGVLRAADVRLKALMQSKLRNSLAWYIPIRGWYGGRALLRQGSNGDNTHVDITPWDPLHTYWGLNDKGVEWACLKLRKTREDIFQQYRVKIPSMNGTAESEGIDVYDYYDGKSNAVVTSDRVLKKRTPHGSPNIPVFLGNVDTQPMIQSDKFDDTMADYGESIYKAARNLYKSHNLMMSVYLELAARARKPPLVVTSRDGTKTLLEEPYLEASEISLAEGESIEPLKMLETTKDAQAILGLVSGDLQRSTVPHSAYGELQFQLSGYAINTLRQGIESVLLLRVDAMQEAYTQIVNLLIDQYATGRFAPFELSGRDQNRKYFSEEISPESIKNAGDIQLEFMAQLPQDDTAQWAQAQIAREGNVPLAPDNWIRDNVLNIQDADNLDDAVKEQLGERMLPQAALYTLMRAMEERGRPDLAALYYGELLKLLLPAPPVVGPPLNGAGGGGPPTVAPAVAPDQALGAPPPAPTPQGGALVPPGTPRPGALSDAARLAGIGLVGPGG